MFGLFKKRQIKKSVEEFIENSNREIEENLKNVWKIENETNFVVELYGIIGQKCSWNKKIECLTYEERIFFIIMLFEGEVNNGGFGQFYLESFGNYANEMENALRVVGAKNLADIFKKSLDALGGKVPENCDERNKELAVLWTDDVDKILSECDDAFFEYSENLYGLLYRYVMANKDKFEKE